jgi:hypothetical protein
MFRDRSIGSMTIAAMVLSSAGLLAQDRPMSPLGTAATQVGGHYVKVAGIADPQYQGGQWIEIMYSRPIKRSRDLWGSGADYGKNLLVGAPVWRAGANVSTRLRTEVPLVIQGQTVAPGEYSLFIDLKPEHWTLIVSNWAAQSAHDPKNKDALWGAFNYTADKDVVRAPMTLSTLPVSVDELTWAFTNMSDRGGGLTLMWDRVVATTPFAVR